RTVRIAFFRGLVELERNFTEELHGREIIFAEVTAHRLGQALFFHELDQSNLRRLVAVLGGGLMLRDHAPTRLQYRRRADFTPRVEQLRHPDFLPKYSCDLRHNLLSVSQRGIKLLAGCFLTSAC